ncbi:unnamed protein product [Paramecium sonneborni]|uniref:Uncharacterized protein n=1 Tax=Paramecium sonneborni TaxID=65129 RepID=A0A8S1QPG3_9CILI|nr:unnamed protein product [Paramecium sonneborni]
MRNFVLVNISTKILAIQVQYYFYESFTQQESQSKQREVIETLGDVLTQFVVDKEGVYGWQTKYKSRGCQKVSLSKSYFYKIISFFCS